MYDLPTTQPEIASFLLAFESGTLPKAFWTHAAHLLTGACYVHAHGEAEAIARMRAKLRHYNESVGGQNTDTSGYHETITIAWIKLLHLLLRQSQAMDQAMDQATFAHLAVRHFASRPGIFEHFYSIDLLASKEARLRWIEPDLQPFTTFLPEPKSSV